MYAHSVANYAYVVGKMQNTKIALAFVDKFQHFQTDVEKSCMDICKITMYYYPKHTVEEPPRISLVLLYSGPFSLSPNYDEMVAILSCYDEDARARVSNDESVIAFLKSDKCH
jgi:hypothetical protein